MALALAAALTLRKSRRFNLDMFFLLPVRCALDLDWLGGPEDAADAGIQDQERGFRGSAQVSVTSSRRIDGVVASTRPTG
jgi:hypothetical protein